MKTVPQRNLLLTAEYFPRAIQLRINASWRIESSRRRDAKYSWSIRSPEILGRREVFCDRNSGHAIFDAAVMPMEFGFSQRVVRRRACDDGIAAFVFAPDANISCPAELLQSLD
jgi:hypothetical protein